jgi:hypothetical protein
MCKSGSFAGIDTVRPLCHRKRRDGLQNLTDSLLAVHLLQAGVYVVMHGTCYPVDRVKKDPVLGRFVWAEKSAE